MMRDPRKFPPMPGDALLYGPQWQLERVDVVSVDGNTVHVKQGYGEHPIAAQNWNKWMASAEVLHVAGA